MDLDNVKNEWLTSGAAFDDIYEAGVLYGIYEDLFRYLVYIGMFFCCGSVATSYVLVTRLETWMRTLLNMIVTKVLEKESVQNETIFLNV